LAPVVPTPQTQLADTATPPVVPEQAPAPQVAEAAHALLDLSETSEDDRFDWNKKLPELGNRSLGDEVLEVLSTNPRVTYRCARVRKMCECNI